MGHARPLCFLRVRGSKTRINSVHRANESFFRGRRAKDAPPDEGFMVATLTSLSGVAFVTYASVLSVFVVGTVAVRVASNVSSRVSRRTSPKDRTDDVEERKDGGYCGGGGGDDDVVEVYVEFWRRTDGSDGSGGI